MTYLSDTNVLLRTFEVGHPQYQVAVDASNRLPALGHPLVLVPQNLYEFWVVSTRPKPQNGRGQTPAETFQDFVRIDLAYQLLPETPDFFDEWRRLMTRYNVSGKPAHDARLVAAMLVYGVTHILTFNTPDFARYAGITAVTPADVLAMP